MQSSYISVPALIWSLDNDCLDRILSFCELQDQWACTKTCTILWRAGTAVKWRNTVRTIGPSSSWMEDLTTVLSLVPGGHATKAVLCDLQRIATEILRVANAEAGEKKESFGEMFSKYSLIQRFQKLYEHDLQTKWAKDPLKYDKNANIATDRSLLSISIMVEVKKFWGDVLVGYLLQILTTNFIFYAADRFDARVGHVLPRNVYANVLQCHIEYIFISFRRQFQSCRTPPLRFSVYMIKREFGPLGPSFRGRDRVTHIDWNMDEWPSLEVSKNENGLQSVLQANEWFRQLGNEANAARPMTVLPSSVVITADQ